MEDKADGISASVSVLFFDKFICVLWGLELFESGVPRLEISSENDMSHK